MGDEKKADDWKMRMFKRLPLRWQTGTAYEVIDRGPTAIKMAGTGAAMFLGAWLFHLMDWQEAITGIVVATPIVVFLMGARKG